MHQGDIKLPMRGSTEKWIRKESNVTSIANYMTSKMYNKRRKEQKKNSKTEANLYLPVVSSNGKE